VQVENDQTTTTMACRVNYDGVFSVENFESPFGLPA